VATATDAVLIEKPDEALVPEGMYRLSERVGGLQHVDAFWLDRHPVTVDRYERFIESGGYDDPDYWDDDGWTWRAKKKIVLPRFWDEPAWRRFLRKNRPVVGVSWYEASAFCRFEGRRLPSERELEAASRGPAGHTYTWGDVWEEGRLGVRGVGPRMTWPVGYFRRARGPFGHDDLIGNVWQWTSDPADPKDEDRAKIVRGGSWASRPDQNRTDSWNAYEPGAQFSHLGFRTAATR
jgi:gamma-glutamyl hercynylcysteine S-oxide synthase